MGVFDDYLKLIIRVRNDFPRAITVLTQFLERPDVPGVLRDQLLSWVKALKELHSHGPADDALVRARTLYGRVHRPPGSGCRPALYRLEICPEPGVDGCRLPLHLAARFS